MVVPAAGILEGARVAACAALARAAAEGRAVAEYAGVAQRAMAARVAMAAWLEEVATARVDCAASLTLNYHPVVQAARGWRQRSRQRRSLPQRRPCSASGAVAWLQKHGRQHYGQPSSSFCAEACAAAGKQRQSASRDLHLRDPGRRRLLVAPLRPNDEKWSPIRRPPRLERRPSRLEARCALWHAASSARGRARSSWAFCTPSAGARDAPRGKDFQRTTQAHRDQDLVPV